LFAQSFSGDAVSGRIYYAEEVLVKDGPQFDLYNRAKAWFSSSGTHKFLAVDDIANGLLIGSNYALLSVADGNKIQTFRLWCTVKIELEDDRYWYSLSDFKLQKELMKNGATSKETQTKKQPLEKWVSKNPAAGNEQLFYQALEAAAHTSIQALIKDLKVSML